MPPKHNVDPKKVEADRLLGFLQELLREEENKYCADCEAKQPRWASWNLGVFLCIRCAGLHRNLGVHISKVKSVNLDSWTAAQVQSMRVMGNAKAKAVYEAELPQLFRRPQSDQTLEAFIRAKYESRRYILRDWCPPPVSAADLPERAGGGLDSSKCGVSKPLTNNHLPMPNSSPQARRVEHHQPSASAQIPVLIDFSAPSPAAPTPSAAAAPVVAVAAAPTEAPLFDPNENLDELFGPIVSAPSAVTTAVSDNKISKDDILALFGSGQSAPNFGNFGGTAPALNNFSINGGGGGGAMGGGRPPGAAAPAADLSDLLGQFNL